MTSALQLDMLREVLGADRFGERDGKPVVAPQTTEEISAITRHADLNGVAIEIAGGGTKRGWGNPIASDLLLETTRLNRVLEHPWQDLTCTVQAGCTWSAMQQELARHKQFVALDPLWPERATVGGIVATNDSGALRHRYGSLRDLIIGMTIVLADGTIAKTGGKVVKNVAGYDLHKLMTGAFGTLGVIAEVTFRLHPLPLHTQTFTVSALQAIQLAPLMAAIRNSHLLPQALQLRGDGSGFHLAIQLNAHPDARQNEILASLADQEVQSYAVEAFHDARPSLFQPNATVIKLSVPPSELCEYLDHMQWAQSVEVACVAQSNGLIHASLVGTPSKIELYLQSLRNDFTILSSAAARGHWNASPNALPLMREIKQQFDPRRTLNPGRFLGGI